MLLEKMCVFVDPSNVLTDKEYSLLYNNTDKYEEIWKSIKAAHHIETNTRAKDIHLYSEKVLTLQSKNELPEAIPVHITTNSGFLIGMEFKDLKKLNPNITAKDLEDAYIVNCVHFGGAMDEDEEAEYIDGYLTFENENYNPSDENSKKNVSYEVCWEIAKEPQEEE